MKYNENYIETAFFNTFGKQLEKLGLVQDGDFRWVGTDVNGAPFSVELGTSFYKSQGRALVDLVIVTTAEGEKTLDYQIPSGGWGEKEYKDHLDAITDDVLKVAGGLVRGIKEGVSRSCGGLVQEIRELRNDLIND